ncbi:MAG: HD domain-containing phosphohydrolase, partial [Bacillota bacterium]|nr:HD domain-containing phosphohydrolase [Bacillota bacterium]
SASQQVLARSLDTAPGVRTLDVVNRWASLHHERLDGRGYPFHYSGRELSLGSRIMSVADVFTALTEKRPYRRAMEAGKALDVVRELGCASPVTAHYPATPGR